MYSSLHKSVPALVSLEATGLFSIQISFIALSGTCAEGQCRFPEQMKTKEKGDYKEQLGYI